MLKVGINGFGRIGRLSMRASLKQDKVKVVAINDLSDNKTLAHLLKYDSVYGILDADLKSDDEGFLLNGERIRVFAEREPAKLPWKDAGVDVVIEATEGFRGKRTGQTALEGCRC